MNDLTSRNLLADAPQANLFLEALAGIDKMLPGDIDRAVEKLTHALAFAYPDDRHVCDVLVRNVTNLPFDKALGALARYAKAHPEHEQQIVCCTPETDPRLHYNEILPDLGFTTGLETHEMPRPSLRSAYRRPRDTAVPKRTTSQRMDTPEGMTVSGSARASTIVLRLLHRRGVMKARDLVRLMNHTVLGSHIAVPYSHTAVALRRLVVDQRLVYRPEGSAQLALTDRGRAVISARTAAEPQIVTEYFQLSLFRDWQAELDRARRLGNTQWEFRLTTERPIRHDQAAIRAAREMIRPLLAAAEAAAAARDERRRTDPMWRAHVSSLAPVEQQAEFWDRVYLGYVTEQIDRDAVSAAQRPWRAREVRLADAAQAARQAFQSQNIRYTRAGEKDHSAPISRELVGEIASQVAESEFDARPRPVEDDSTTRASMRTGIWISTDFRDAPEHRGDGIEVDYSKAAKTPVRGWRCVFCFIERASCDAMRPDGRSDDGLCESCREDGRPGIPALPEGFTYADVVAAHCRFLTTEYPAVAEALLRDRLQRAEKNSPTARAIEAFTAGGPALPDRFSHAEMVAAHCHFLLTEYPSQAHGALRSHRRHAGKDSVTGRAITAFLAERPDGPGDTGIAATLEGFSHADVVTAHCHFLAIEFPSQARAMLRSQWLRAGKDSPTARAIAAFMAEHPDLPDHRARRDAQATAGLATPRRRAQGAPVIGKGVRRDRCKGCHQNASVDDSDYCISCRVSLGHIQTAPKRRRRVA
ncbi:MULTISPECIES: hypothetical protein [Nocardia]|uniref:Uncharacterized protein n=1 Tax=Nocardia africana TaxID=134964 RepID=A0A378X5M6_9NOCA|nr:hypothetical protein [Nocardia africana]MCC3317954.1 hypothetical protein [Nocardia africana]SUA48729.1 Uncharacterised protein [Nocardia africana]